MTLYRLKAAPVLLIQDDASKNILPLLLELAQNDKSHMNNLFCYEQPVSFWRRIFKGKNNVIFHEEFNPELFGEHSGKINKCSIIIDSVNQMALCLGWKDCLNNIKSLINSHNVAQIILVLHKDCLPHASKLQLQLNHIASAIVSYDNTNPCKIFVQLKKSGKVMKTEEILSYDNSTSTLKSTPIVKEKHEDEVVKPLPNTLSTFKIEMEQTEQLEKHKLKLPYMSKQEGESKVYYEPDSVDDWDEEDPDEDLDI